MKFLRSQNVTLEKLCSQPDMLGKPVVVISPSVHNKIKVTVGRKNDHGQFLELKIKVINTTEDAIILAKESALVVGTDFIYEIRIYKDHSSECIRILQDIEVESELTNSEK